VLLQVLLLLLVLVLVLVLLGFLGPPLVPPVLLL
jgi:hypothetical protein